VQVYKVPKFLYYRSMKIPTNKLFSTFSLKSWVPYFQKNGERVIDVMTDNQVPVHEFYNFYTKNGDTQREFVEKIINERIKEDSFGQMTNVQCAYLGLNALQSLQKEIMVEIYHDEQQTPPVS